MPKTISTIENGYMHTSPSAKKFRRSDNELNVLHKKGVEIEKSKRRHDAKSKALDKLK